MSKLLIPAFKCVVGDWHYYIASMKYGVVENQVQLAHEIHKNTQLGALIQRGLSDRTKDITEYLLTSEHRFLGAMVVAAWGGKPDYTPVTIEDRDGWLKGLDSNFGVLTFDGTQRYFALDGQHRLQAIRDAIKKNPELGSEDICVILVAHKDDKAGRIKTRRLFSNINRNAVKTSTAEDIVLDEDDGLAIITRQLLEEHEFLKQEGRVKVTATPKSEEGKLKLAGNSISKSDKTSVTTLPVLYDIIQYLGWDLPKVVRAKKARPSDKDVESSYQKLAARLDDLLKNCGGIRHRIEEFPDARQTRGMKGSEGDGHPFMRPVIQKAVAQVVGAIVHQGNLSWDETMKRLAKLKWKMSEAPWIAVYSKDGGKMLGSKDNVDVLRSLLHVHLAPASQQAIKTAKRNYKIARNETYPVSDDVLEKGRTGVKTTNEHAPVVEPREELSEAAEMELTALTNTADTD